MSESASASASDDPLKAIQAIRVAKRPARNRPHAAEEARLVSFGEAVVGDDAGGMRGRVEGWMIQDQVIDFFNESLHAAECLANASQIIGACRLYANDHQGNYPVVLSELVPKYLADPSVFGRSSYPNPKEIGYEYFGGKTSDPPTEVLLRGCYTTTDGKRTVFRVDGSGTRERPWAEDQRGLR